MPKTFEMDGETYIVSDEVDNLDTEALVDKSVIHKILERVEKATASYETKEKITKKNNMEVVFTLESENASGKKEIISISGGLTEYSFQETFIECGLLLTVDDFCKIPNFLHTEKVFIIGFMLLCDGKTVTNFKETKFVRIAGFVANDFLDNQVACKIVISTLSE
jgi:hypothetical protein